MIKMFVFLVFILAISKVSAKLSYPTTKKVDQVDDYFGTKVADPYRWLEIDTAENVKAWVKEQNKVSYGYLEKIPFRNKLKARITELYNFPKYSAPMKAGKYFIFSKNDGLQNQAVYYIQEGESGQPKVFLDPNKMSEKGTTSADIIAISQDNKYAVYSISQAGSDWNQFKIKEIPSGKDLKDEVNWVKFSGAAFYKGGFFYSRFDEPKKGKELTTKNEFHKVYYHKIGENQSSDKLIFVDNANPLYYNSSGVTEDEKYLILDIWSGTYGSELRVKDLTKENSEFVTLAKGFKNETEVIDNIGDKFICITDYNASNKRIVEIDLKNPDEKNWKDIIKEEKELLQGCTSAGRKLFVEYLKDVTTRVYQFDLDGKNKKEIKLPDLGTAGGFGGKKEDIEIYYSFTSYIYPSTIFKYNIKTGESSLFRKSEVKFNPSEFETNQVFYKSNDGTNIPMFIVCKKGLNLDGNNPTLLHSYGGFNANSVPTFFPHMIAFLEKGGIYAVANIRGGGEYGDSWHKAGMLLNKQNVFDDYIAAAEYLIINKYTSSKKLAIYGRSNGGLLIGAVLNQRPDLFRVAFPTVGVMDMLRYHKFTIGYAWASEYGSSEDAANFANLYHYSPLHNIFEGLNYPSIMVMTSDHDDRVVPAHSFKYAATLQEKYKGDNPVLIRIQTDTGHGAGKSTTKVIEDETDKIAFLLYEMGQEY